MLLACVAPNGNKKVFEITNFFLVPRRLPKLLHTSFDTLIASVLISIAGKNGKCYPGYSYLMTACGIKSEKTVHNSVTRLRNAGLIRTSSRGTSKSLSYTFIWHPTWEACLSKKAAASADVKALRYGDEFNPHNLFDTLVLHKSIMGDATMSPTPKVIMAYVMHKVGTNDCAWPTQEQIMRDTGIVKSTTRLAVKELEARQYIRAVRRLDGDEKLLRNSYYLIFGNTAVADMVEKHASENTSTPTEKYIQMRFKLRVNSIKRLSAVEVIGGKSDDLPPDHYYGLPKPESVVVFLKEEREVDEYLSSLPVCPRSERLRKWYRDTSSKIEPMARLKMALQMVTKKDILNKAAYLNTLITMYFKGEYHVAGVELMMTDYAGKVDYEWRRQQPD